MNPEEFNIWFPALVGGLVVGLLVAALWDVLRRKTWRFASKIWPGVLKEVGLENSCLSRAEVEEKQREVTDMLSALSTQITRALVPVKQSMAEAAQYSSSSGSSNCGVICKFDLESQTGNNPAYTGTPITFTATVYLPDDTPTVVIRPTKKFFKRYAKGTVKRWRSSIILQAPMPIEPCVLAEIGELARNCMLEDNRCVFQLGNWAILYYNVGEVHLHILKEGDVPVNVEARWQPERTDITMRGLYLNGAQVKVATKHTSTILRSDGPAIQGAGDLDELHLSVEEVDFPGEDSFIYASKVVEADGISLLVRSEASFILPPRGTFALIEALCGQLQRIAIFAKDLINFFLQNEDLRPETTTNVSENLRFDHEHLELIVEHWNGVSEIELLDYRKEVLHYLQELQASGIVERAGPPSLDSHLIFIRDESYLKYWQEGLQVLNEVIHRNSSDSHSHTHIRVRGGIQFLLGDFESALQDYDLAHLSTRGHQSTVLLERALVKCMLGRYSEAMQDVVAVITLSPSGNDIQELETCIQQILNQQRAFRKVARSGPLCQRSLLPDQDNTMVEIPDLLTGNERHSGEIESLRPISDAGTAGGWASDPPSKHAKSVGDTGAHWSMTSVAESFKLQLKLTNYAESLESKPRHHVRRISFIVTILEDGCDPDDVVKPMSTDDLEMLSWQAPTEDLQDDLKIRNDLSSLSERLCPYKNISLTLYGNVTDDDSHVQRRGPHPLSCYRHVSFRRAMLTKHSAIDGEVQMFLYGEFLGDRNYLPWRSDDYTKELVTSVARPLHLKHDRLFWLVQWDVVDMWHISSNGLKRHRGSDARTNPRISISANCKPHASRQILPRSGRKRGTSQYYGVRFRPDLEKWVAEVRVPEWKAVDKKVWLGTFATEQAAARAVDLARKLVKCSKKHPLNFPCEKLEAYSRQIPRQLILTDLNDTSMFKQVTSFIKLECREYAASFDDTPSEQIIPAFDQHDSFGGQFFNPTSSINPPAQGYENMPPPQ